MAGKGGGQWKVAYADFVTAMMAFFMVMWITAQSDKVKQAVAHYFNYPTAFRVGTVDGPEGASGPGLPGPGGPGGPNLDSSGNYRDAFGIQAVDMGFLPNSGGRGNGKAKSAAEANKGRTASKPSVLAVHEGDRRMVGTVIPFEEHSAELTETGQKRLAELVPALAGKRNKIEVRGHTTRRPLPAGSPFRDAWQLAYARCLAVQRFLEARGIEAERIRLSQAGPFEPQTLETEPHRLEENSRVEIYVLAELVEDLMGTPQERAARLRGP